MKRILDHIRRAARLRDSGSSRRIHSAMEFASILNRERDRTDRTGQAFSLVVFETDAGSRSSAAVKNLVAVLMQRTHSTDDIGWLDDGRIATVHPHTTPDGAWKFVENVRKSLGSNAPVPECTVYVYPSNWITRVDGAISHPRSPSKRSGLARGEAAKYACSMESLGPLFLQPIPLWKRGIDVFGSLAAMILLSPLTLLVMALIRIVSPGPIFFHQERVGHLGKKFTLWKFRTMHLNADTTVHQEHIRELIASGKEMTKLDNGKDPRIIPFGNLLRATGIDELPQLLNVLRGEMSLIGPRPCLPYEASGYLPWQMRRFDAVPGLTGLWQVSGKNRTTFGEMMALDIRYAKSRAFLLDVKIFLKTLPAIARQVADRPFFSAARAKGFSTVVRSSSLLIVLTQLVRHRK